MYATPVIPLVHFQLKIVHLEMLNILEAHLVFKWTKTLQDHRSHHVIQLPKIKNPLLCPVRALKKLLDSKPLPPHHPLFANNFPPYTQVIDSYIRDALKRVLTHKTIPKTLKHHLTLVGDD